MTEKSNELMVFEIYSALGMGLDEKGPKKILEYVEDYDPSAKLGSKIDEILKEKQTDPDIGPCVIQLIDAIEEARQNPVCYSFRYIKQGLLYGTRSEVAPKNKLEEIVENAITSDEKPYKRLNIVIWISGMV